MRIELYDQVETEKRKAKLDKIGSKDLIVAKMDKGFAFSAAPGNDRLINDTLSNRIKDALAKKLFPDMEKTMSEKKVDSSARSASQGAIKTLDI